MWKTRSSSPERTPPTPPEPGTSSRRRGTTPHRCTSTWSKIAAYLRGIGDDIAPVPRDVVLADHVLRVVDELEQADVPPPVPRSFGLTAA
ncbi:hypothetical protein [Streptomyces sp. NPDC050585]|uniref:hypothetical protein n=1 Tax=unclassified Streptomyces TaxID=2593676 RepID=UPI0037AE5770